MPATVTFEDVGVRTTMPESTFTCARRAGGSHLFRPGRCAGACAVRARHNYVRDVGVRTTVSEDRPGVPKEREGAVPSDAVGARAITVYREIIVCFRHGLRLADI